MSGNEDDLFAMLDNISDDIFDADAPPVHIPRPDEEGRWVSVVEIFGGHEMIPPDAAVVVKEAIRAAEYHAALTEAAPWLALEMMAAEFLATYPMPPMVDSP
jgi:hypothetical protein